MIRKLLIANRGEIACRVIRTCREMSIATVAVYSDADADALHVQRADEAVHIGASAAGESYLNIERIIDAAKRTGADAIHPGYGFLAENADFAQAVIDAGIVWVGPSPESIRAMGKKREAKLLLEGVPLVPGYEGDDQTDAAFISAAERIGFPLMVKASAGGGGKGMRRVESPDDLSAALAMARREASGAFGDDTLILERYVQNPRHIEIQIFGDAHGNIIAIGERECSIQRRHQKIIEETPSPAVDDDLRGRMSAVAVSIGQQLGYVGAGTVEFLLDESGEFYFMEMNTRLQVEHPVTEMVYGVDLVKLQISVAEGKTISKNDVLFAHGHAIEARIYAEDPARDFLPATGEIALWSAPKAVYVRVDDGIQTGDEVTINYDPMIAKIIAYGDDRIQAIRALDHALANTRLLGLRHNIAFLRRVVTHADFIAGNTDTSFIDIHPDLMPAETSPPDAVLIAVAMAQTGADAGWRNNRFRPLMHRFASGETAYTVELTPRRDGDFAVSVDGREYGVRALDGGVLVIDGHRVHIVTVQQGEAWWAHYDGEAYHLLWCNPLPLPGSGAQAAGSLRAPMPGQVINISAEVGQTVSAGDVLMALEAMKMEHRIHAPYDGVVNAVYYRVGDTVVADAVLLEVEPTE